MMMMDVIEHMYMYIYILMVMKANDDDDTDNGCENEYGYIPINIYSFILPYLRRTSWLSSLTPHGGQ